MVAVDWFLVSKLTPISKKHKLKALTANLRVARITGT